jgi:hypothetical protein
MRETCLFCVSKHISQAIILTTESVLGYPLHYWLAIGHLAEAETESVMEFPEIAKEIRTARCALMGQEGIFKPDSLMKLLETVRKIAESYNEKPEAQWINEIIFGKIGETI